jgi:phytoene/squalene synthetase
MSKFEVNTKRKARVVPLFVITSDFCGSVFLVRYSKYPNRDFVFGPANWYCFFGINCQLPMNDRALFNKASIRCCRLITESYSTSFSIGIRCLQREMRNPIYSIYAFVRLADEIVDTFHEHDKRSLLQRFETDTYRALHEGVSLNPVLNSFQVTANHYGIGEDLIRQFLKSMAMDLTTTRYNAAELEEYILGSAEVVGLMCLKVFCKRNPEMYAQLKPYAMSLGSAFQKVNFLRDLKADYAARGRTYFPGIEISRFDDESKKKIEAGIEKDFCNGYAGIKKLPRGARLGVYVAYLYYFALFEKIRNTPSEMVLRSRIRIKSHDKARLLAYSFVKHQLNLI